MLFEFWIRMVINEVLLIIFTHSYFISVDTNFETVILIQNLTTWVKFTLALICNKFSYTAYKQKIMIFESWTSLVIS